MLIIAEHASAKFGGEAILPLHYFRVLRKRGVEAWLIVHARTRNELTALFPHDLDRIHFIPDSRFLRLLTIIGKPLPGQLRHFTVGFAARLLSQLEARQVAKKIIAAHRVNVIHQPIPVSPKESSLIHCLGVPVIIGPMNGGMTYPPGFTQSQGAATALFMRIGRAFSGLLNRLMPGKLRAELLLVANERTRRALPGSARGRVITLVENGVDLSLWKRAETTDLPANSIATAPAPTRFAFTGRLVDWKAVDILLDAFKLVVAQVPATLDILGNGRMRPELEAQARALDLNSHVKFHGWVAQPQCVQTLRQVDALVLPSLYECGGAVVLEAMAMSLPVIATDWGGPADYLDPTCGILVPPRSREQFVADLAAAMVRLARAPELRQEMGRAGRRRVEESFDWERKADRTLEIYRETITSASA